MRAHSPIEMQDLWHKPPDLCLGWDPAQYRLANLDPKRSWIYG
jgi:hypothetical protein